MFPYGSVLKMSLGFITINLYYLGLERIRPDRNWNNSIVCWIAGRLLFGYNNN